jgi:putative two-component system response regulator
MTVDDHALKQLPILAVDDEEANVLLLRRVLERAGYVSVATTTDPAQVPMLFLQTHPRLLLLDLHMPRMDGFELMERLGPLTSERRSIPFLVLTADVTEEAKRRALSLGARDFLTKPLDQIELLLRVRNLLQVQLLQDKLFEHNATLEELVAERTLDLEHARLEILERLALAAEYRDDATQEHAWRIGRTCFLLAVALGLPTSDAELLRRAAPLHDIGKIGIPDAVLLKPGKLTDEEFEQMKAHSTIGAEILSGSSSSLLRMAEKIALTHHEWWDGQGYPNGLAGERIPLAGRIAAVADVFDALTHQRPYKHAWTIEDGVAEIFHQGGHHFDPAVVHAFATLDHAALLTRANEWEPPVAARVLRDQPLLATSAGSGVA